MAEAARDQNRVTVLMVTDVNTGAVVPALVDHATGYLLLSISGDGTPNVLTGDAPRDNNRVTACLAEDEVSGDPVPVLADSNGYLYVDTEV